MRLTRELASADAEILQRRLGDDDGKNSQALGERKTEFSTELGAPVELPVAKAPVEALAEMLEDAVEDLEGQSRCDSVPHPRLAPTILFEDLGLDGTAVATVSVDEEFGRRRRDAGDAVEDPQVLGMLDDLVDDVDVSSDDLTALAVWFWDQDVDRAVEVMEEPLPLHPHET